MAGPEKHAQVRFPYNNQLLLNVSQDPMLAEKPASPEGDNVPPFMRDYFAHTFSAWPSPEEVNR